MKRVFMSTDFKQWRKERSLTQEQAGGMIGVSPSTWHVIERSSSEDFLPGEKESIIRLLAAHELDRYAAVTCYADALTHEELKALRLSYGVDHAGFGALIGCSRTHVGNMERGTKAIAPRYRLAIAALVLMGELKQDEPAATVELELPAIENIGVLKDGQIVTYDFAGHAVQVVEADEIMMSDRQLGEALGYAKPYQAIRDLAAAHMDELTAHQTHLDLRCPDGSDRNVRVWREQGVYLLTMFSAQPKAKDFRQFAAATLFNVRRAPAVIDPIEAQIVALQELQKLKARQAELEKRFAQVELQQTEIKFLEATKIDRSDAVDIIQGELRAQAEQEAARLMLRKDLEAKEHAAVWAVINKYGGDFGDLVKDLRKRVRKAVHETRGVKSWGRDLYQKCDYAIAYAALELWSAMHNSRPPEQKRIDFDGEVQA